MARAGGNPNLKGVKGRSGRKSHIEEFGRFEKKMREEIRAEELIKIANRIIGKRLILLEEKDDVLSDKEFAMPLVLKGLAEKIDHTSKGESIIPTNTLEIKELVNILNEIHGGTNIASDGTSSIPMGKEVSDKE